MTRTMIVRLPHIVAIDLVLIILLVFAGAICMF